MGRRPTAPERWWKAAIGGRPRARMRCGAAAVGAENPAGQLQPHGQKCDPRCPDQPYRPRLRPQRPRRRKQQQRTDSTTSLGCSGKRCDAHGCILAPEWRQTRCLPPDSCRCRFRPRPPRCRPGAPAKMKVRTATARSSEKASKAAQSGQRSTEQRRRRQRKRGAGNEGARQERTKFTN